MKPYLIYHGGGYTRTSAGVAVIHKLCHYLNNHSCDAYMLEESLNPEWNTKCASSQMQAKIAAAGIVVYPEVIHGNPLGARYVARYVLNIPGLLGGDKTYPATEKVFIYFKYLDNFVPDPKWLLRLPILDTRYFNQHDWPAYRPNRCFYVGKGVGKSRKLDMETGAKEITREWPTTHVALADLFKSSHEFVTYDDATCMSAEARACGCPVTIIDGRREICTDKWESAGMAYSLEEREKAKEEVWQFYPYYMDNVEAEWPEQLQRFIEITQA